MKSNHNGNRVDTALEEIIATISDVAFENSNDTKEAYDIARLVLVAILKGRIRRSEIVDPHFRRGRYLR